MFVYFLCFFGSKGFVKSIQTQHIDLAKKLNPEENSFLSFPVIEIYSALNLVHWVECELGSSDLLCHHPRLLHVLLLHPHLPVEGCARVIVVKVDPVKEQLLHDRVVDVGVVSENLEAGEDLEVMKEVRIVLLKAAMHNVYFTSWDVH